MGVMATTPNKGNAPTGEQDVGEHHDSSLVSAALKGFRESLSFLKFLKLYVMSVPLQTKINEIALLNLIILVSFFFASHILDPCIQGWLSPNLPYIYYWREILRWTVNVFWIYPIFGLSVVLGAVSYPKIALTTHNLHYKTTTTQKFDFDWIVTQFTYKTYRLMLCVVFFAQAQLVFYIPVIGPVLSLLLTSWLYAFYCFEYGWILRGWTLERQIEFFERRWAYFLGFGFPVAFFDFSGYFAEYMPKILSNPPQMLFFRGASPCFAPPFQTMLFPMCVVIATVASPRLVQNSQSKQSRLPIFSFAQNCSHVAIGILFRLWRRSAKNAAKVGRFAKVRFETLH
eukprot:c15876_g1_i1.p1 GENE.c15876_g1_i1~~c15876_g1_i1.p1  ORF type:complete len:342 (-),score=43.72 c15876_g1_i1:69-1094(-)